MSPVIRAVALASVFTAAGRAADDDPAGNKVLVRAAVEQMFGGRDPALADRFVAEGYVEHNPRLAGGRAGVVAFLERVRAGFPNDYHADITQMFGEDDRVTVFIRWHGVQDEPFLGMPPTGKDIAFNTADIWRVQDGKLAEHWDVVDQTDRALAMGLVVRPE